MDTFLYVNTRCPLWIFFHLFLCCFFKFYSFFFVFVYITLCISVVSFITVLLVMYHSISLWLLYIHRRLFSSNLLYVWFVFVQCSLEAISAQRILNSKYNCKFDHFDIFNTIPPESGHQNGKLVNIGQHCFLCSNRYCVRHKHTQFNSNTEFFNRDIR